MALYTELWQAGDITDPNTMAVTLKFDDVAIDDTTTYESYTSPSEAISVGLDMTGMITFNPAYTNNLTAWRFTFGSAFSGQPQSTSGSYTVQYYNGAIWTTLATGSLTVNNGPGGGVLSFIGNTGVNGTCNVNIQRLRVHVIASLTTVAPHILTIAISDFRATFAAFADMQATGLIDIFAGAQEQEASASGTMIPSGSGETDNGCVRLRETGCIDAATVRVAPATTSHAQVGGATTSKASVVDCATPRRRVRP